MLDHLAHYDFITQDASATEADCLNRVDLSMFHYFNPSGAKAEWEKACADIDAAVDAGRCKNGAIIAHGSMNDHAAELLYRCVRRRRAASVRDVRYAIDAVRRATQSARDFLAKLPA